MDRLRGGSAHPVSLHIVVKGLYDRFRTRGTLSSDLTTANADAVAAPPLIGALLRMPWEVVRERMLEGLHARGYTGLITAHLTVLQYPGPDGLRPSELARRTRMTKQALNYLLGQMEQLGYLIRTDDPNDRRSKQINLTTRGRAALTAMREVVLEVEAEWEQQLGPERFAQLRDLLTSLGAAQPGRHSSESASPGSNRLTRPSDTLLLSEISTRSTRDSS